METWAKIAVTTYYIDDEGLQLANTHSALVLVKNGQSPEGMDFFQKLLKSTSVLPADMPMENPRPMNETEIAEYLSDEGLDNGRPVSDEEWQAIQKAISEGADDDV